MEKDITVTSNVIKTITKPKEICETEVTGYSRNVKKFTCIPATSEGKTVCEEN